MHRALLARETAAESLHDTFGARENAPATMGGIGIIERVFVVLHERYGNLHLDRRGDDYRFDREFAKAAHIPREEHGHGHRGQRKGVLGTTTRPHDKLVGYEIKLHREGKIAVRHR